MRYYDRAWAEVDLNAILNNVSNMKKNIDKNTMMMGIIKTDGYGHGAIPIADMIEDIDYVFGYGVATAEEAMELRDAGMKKPILILGYTFEECYEDLIQNDIRPATFSSDMLEIFNKYAKKLKKKFKIHIKVDTGMSRIGIIPDDEGMAFVKKAFSYEWLEVEGIFTHFAKADEIDKTSVNEQIKRFKTFTDRIENELGLHIPIKHCSNSAGIVELLDANMDMVRAGITLYGLWPSDEVRQDIVPLAPALSLFARIGFIKTVKAGVGISYGLTFAPSKDAKIATVTIGYGDGYPRSLSNKGYVLVKGQRAPIVGRICMDQMMIDVSDIAGEVKVGDVVTLIGKDGDQCITMEELGNLSGRFNYELACDLGKRIPRIYKK